MAKPIGPKKVHRYSDEFKTTAVKLSQLSRVQVQDVAEALDIHACAPALTTTHRKSMRDWCREAVSTFSGEDHRRGAGRSAVR